MIALVSLSSVRSFLIETFRAEGSPRSPRSAPDQA